MKKSLIMVIITMCVMVLIGCAAAPAPAPEPTPPPAQPAQPPASTTPATPPPAPDTPPPPVRAELVLDGASRYTVASGDSLSLIAARVYGQANMYYFPILRLANPSITNPDFIAPGTSIIIPNLQQNLNSEGARIVLRSEMLSTAQHYERQNQPNAAAEIRNLANRL